MKKMLVALVVAFMSILVYATPASAVEILPPRTVVLGDSIVGSMCGGNHQSIPTRIVPLRDGGCYGWPGATSGGLWRQTYEPGWIDPGNTNLPSQQFNIKDAIVNADVIVIGLGTNNALRTNEPLEWFGYDIDNFMRLANGKRVIWFDVGIQVWPGSLGNWAQWQRASQLDTILWNKRAQYPNLTVLPWGGEIGARPDYVIGDGVHTSTAGYFRRWEMAKYAI